MAFTHTVAALISDINQQIWRYVPFSNTKRQKRSMKFIALKRNWVWRSYRTKKYVCCFVVSRASDKCWICRVCMCLHVVACLCLWHSCSLSVSFLPTHCNVIASAFVSTPQSCLDLWTCFVEVEGSQNRGSQVAQFTMGFNTKMVIHDWMIGGYPHDLGNF